MRVRFSATDFQRTTQCFDFAVRHGCRSTIETDYAENTWILQDFKALIEGKMRQHIAGEERKVIFYLAAISSVYDLI